MEKHLYIDASMDLHTLDLQLWYNIEGTGKYVVHIQYMLKVFCKRMDMNETSANGD